MQKTSSHGKVPKSAPRRNPEARREQNRIASRNYREKRKQKLALLNTLLEPEDNAAPTSSTFDENLDASSISNHVVQNSDITPPQSVVSQNQTVPIVDFASNDDFILPVGMEMNTPQPLPFVSNTWDLAIPSPPFASATPVHSQFNNMPVPFSMDLLATGFGENVSPGLTSSISINSAPPTQPVESSPSLDKDETLHKVLKGAEHLSLNQKRNLIQLLQNQIQETSPPSKSSSSSTDGHTYLLPRTRLQLEALQFSVAIRLTATAGPSRCPSEYTMNTGLFRALFANCFALGMADIGPLLIDDGWSIFGLGPEVAYHPSQLSVVRAKFRNLTPALQPCDKQLTVAHHPYIDVIPFKTFRERILSALDHDPPLLDEDALCHDLLTGLVCWGSQHTTLGMDAAVPWDVRSWEPDIWFLRKYRDFVGGWDDEMWKGARWYHNMRGERIETLS